MIDLYHWHKPIHPVPTSWMPHGGWTHWLEIKTDSWILNLKECDESHQQTQAAHKSLFQAILVYDPDWFEEWYKFSCGLGYQDKLIVASPFEDMFENYCNPCPWQTLSTSHVLLKPLTDRVMTQFTDVYKYHQASVYSTAGLWVQQWGMGFVFLFTPFIFLV